MSGLKVLISPLSWGYGHAGRMIPLALELKRRGCEVIFAADAGLLQMAERDLPDITMVEIPGLRIRYSRFLPQYLCIFLQLPRIIISSFRDHVRLRSLAEKINPSIIISDNRFGFYHREIFSVYVTHQVRIPFPAALRFMEPLAEMIHRAVINRYDLCLIPDYPGDVNLAGRLSHRGRSWSPGNFVYTGPLSRFYSPVPDTAKTDASSFSPSGDPEMPFTSSVDPEMPSASPGDPEQQSPPADNPLPHSTPYICLLLSGPEPQRSLLLEKVVEALGSGPSDQSLVKPPEVHRVEPPGDHRVEPPGDQRVEPPGDHRVEPSGDHLDEAAGDHRLVPSGDHLGDPPGDHLGDPPGDHRSEPSIDHRVVPGTGIRSPAESPAAIHLRVLTATPLNRMAQSGIEIQYIITPSTPSMRRIITGASLVIARAGYSSIMELASMRRGAVLIPTPGQPEQEYLGKYLDGRYGYVTLRQNRLEGLSVIAQNRILQAARYGNDNGSGEHLPDAAPLFERAITRLHENNKK